VQRSKILFCADHVAAHESAFRRKRTLGDQLPIGRDFWPERFRWIAPPANHRDTGIVGLGKVGVSSEVNGQQRSEYVDTARGIACVLLVTWHVIGSTPTNGLEVPPNSYWRFFADFFIYFRMPMFAFISGYVYAHKPFTGQASRFLAGKTRRLILPLFTVGTFFALVEWLVPGTNVNKYNIGPYWATLHFVPIAHYWFLESLFITFLVVVALESLRLLDSRWKFILILAAAVAINLTVAPPHYVGLSGAVYLFPYFLCGLACSRFHIENPRFFLVSIAVFIVAYAYAAGGMLGYLPFSTRTSIAALLIGVTGSFVVLRSGWKNCGLAFIGASSYSIFLFHVFFSASSRMLMHTLGIWDIGLLFVVGTVTALCGPILLERVADRYTVTRTTLLGKKWSANNIENAPLPIFATRFRALGLLGWHRTGT
jgi:fucose 4-O-acetylase-like acetyltransferase